MPRLDTHPTPNPDSIKFTTRNGAPFIAQGMESFNTPEEAAGHRLGERLFAVPGIANIFALPQFVTVTKHPAASWDDLLPKLKAVLAAYFEEEEPPGR